MIDKKLFTHSGDKYLSLTARQTIADGIDLKKHTEVLAFFKRSLLYKIAEELPVKFTYMDRTFLAQAMILQHSYEQEAVEKEYTDLNKLNDELITKVREQAEEIKKLNETLNKLVLGDLYYTKEDRK